MISFDNRDSGLSTEFDGPPPTRRRVGEGDRAAPAPNASRLSARTTWPATRSACSTRSASTAAHVVGMSMGGMIAQEIAIEYPDRVRTLTSIMSTTGNPRVGRPKCVLVRKALRRERADAGQRDRAQHRDVPRRVRADLRRRRVPCARRDSRSRAASVPTARRDSWRRSSPAPTAPTRSVELRVPDARDPRHARSARPAVGRARDGTGDPRVPSS